VTRTVSYFDVGGKCAEFKVGYVRRKRRRRKGEPPHKWFETPSKKNLILGFLKHGAKGSANSPGWGALGEKERKGEKKKESD